MTTFFTSDTHFWHKNVIGYCKRPVPGIPEEELVSGKMNHGISLMNEWLIERWNEKVKKDDEVWHLGDFAFCGKGKAIAILERLNGHKHLVLGNHDYGLANKVDVNVFFESIQHYKRLMVHDKEILEGGVEKQFHQPIILCHFPILSWDGMHHGSWHLHGHCHGSLPDNRSMRIDVGVDPMGYYPVSFEQIKEIMSKRKIVKVDHH